MLLRTIFTEAKVGPKSDLCEAGRCKKTNGRPVSARVGIVCSGHYLFFGISVRINHARYAKRLGLNHVRFPSGGSWPGTLLSRFEITQSQNVPLGFQRPPKLFTRHWGLAELLMPNKTTLVVHSAHLFPTADPVNRLAEIRAMVKSMQAGFAKWEIDVVNGDLNHSPDTEEYKLWMEAGWIDTFAKVGVGEGPTIKADIPKWRIDYVLAAGGIANQVVESRPLFEGGFV